MNDQEMQAFAGMMLIILGVGCIVGLAIQVFICWLLSSWVARIPPEHRKVQPGQVWLLLIPLFNIVWNFFVYPPMADSFDSYFKAKGEPADTGRGLAMAYCVMVPCGIIANFIPFLNLVYGLVLFVVWILVLVKFHGLKNRIPQA